MGKIDRGRAEVMLAELPGWTLHESAIQRVFLFSGFADAVAFVVRLGFEAEAADHHPEMLVNYRRVTVTYTTHSANGLTEKDFDGADVANRIAALLAIPEAD